MPRPTPTEWWNRYIEPTCNEDAEVITIDIRRLVTSMFERAWNDLTVSPDIKPEHRRSAIKWFKGYNQEDVLFNYKFCASIIGMTEKRKLALEERIRRADRYFEIKEDKAAA